MTPLHGLFAAISAVILFLYGLQGFSRELQAVGGATLQSWLGRVTANRWIGFLVGAARRSPGGQRRDDSDSLAGFI